jgi:hypothetical protein
MKQLVTQKMEQAYELKVPLKVELESARTGGIWNNPITAKLDIAAVPKRDDGKGTPSPPPRNSHFHKDSGICAQMPERGDLQVNSSAQRS